MPSQPNLIPRFSLSCSLAWVAASRLAQAEEASWLVKRRGDLQSAVVGRKRLDGALPIRRANACNGFENEPSVRQRPGKGEARVGARDAEANAGGGAGVQQHRDAARVEHREVGLAVAVEVAHRCEERIPASLEVDGTRHRLCPTSQRCWWR